MFLNTFKSKSITLRGVCFLLKYKIYSQSFAYVCEHIHQFVERNTDKVLVYRLFLIYRFVLINL